LLFIRAAKEHCANGSSSADSRLIEEVQRSPEAEGVLGAS